VTSLVSVVIPCYNEERTIARVLEALAGQTYPLAALEVLVADGNSKDRTRERIAEFQAHHPSLSVRIIDNPERSIPTALNRGIRAAHGEYIVRLDAHAIPSAGYVEHSIELLAQDIADNVGGCWQIAPGDDTPAAKAVALAVGHPLGAGDAQYRYGRQAAYVDTTPFGAFKRSTLDHVGLYDETLLVNEDYDLNYRIRRSGGRIYLSPAISSTYFARRSPVTLARQYFRYGWWKVRMLRKDPHAIRPRQLAPPLLVAALILLGAGGLFWGPLAFTWRGLVVAYLAIATLVATAIIAQTHDTWRVWAWLPVTFVTIHLSWGLGFWASLLYTPWDVLRHDA
jgi:succinoglycan biosynthesis protein ExoA